MPVIYLTNMSSIEEAFEESGRQVALTSVSDNDDDRLSRKLWTSDYLTGSLQGPATGDTRDNALFCGSATGEGDGLITGNQQDPVNDGLVEVIRDKARAPALDLVRSLVTFSNDGGLGGLGTEDLDLGILLLEVLASARDGATGTDTGDDGVDLALGIVPDLLTSAIMMDRRISGVIELAGQDGTGVFSTISAALLLAPGTPSAPGVSTSSAPSRRMMARRSFDIVSGIVMMTL